MKKITYGLFFATFFSVAIFNSCKKNAPDSKNCRILTVSSPIGIVYNFTYNADGKISTVTNGNYTTSFNYNGTSIVSTTLFMGAFNKKATITLNSKGLAVNVKLEPGPAGEAWANLLYEYNSEQLIKRTFTSSTGGMPEILVYNWTGGNNSSIFIDGRLFVEYEYYTDKAIQGDINNLIQFTKGYEIIRNKNLIKLEKYSNGTQNNINYTFDSEGKIITAISGGSVNYSYQYQCN